MTKTNQSLFPLLAICTMAFWLSGCGSDNNSQPPVDTTASVPEAVSPSPAQVFLPPDDKILLFLGQDTDTISDYARDVPEDNLEAVTLYTQLKSANSSETLLGVFSTANWRSGDVNFGETLAQAPGAALAIGLALDQCNQAPHAQNIANGDYDSTIEVMADYFKSIAPRKVFLRIGYEFDGPWNCYEPVSYKAAYRHIVKRLRELQVTNMTSVWQSATWPDPTIAGDKMALYDHRRASHLDDWYPGDDVVDWVSLSVFYRDLSQWNYTPVDTPAASQEKLLAFAREHNKPVMISEAAPQAYRTGAETHSYIGLNTQTPHSGEEIWRDWYVPFFSFIKENRDVIRAVAYINTHWESQPRWFCAENSGPPASDCPEGNWGDSRVQANSVILANWLEEVTNAELWVQDPSY